MRRAIVGLVVLGLSFIGTNAFTEGNDGYTVLLLHCNGTDGSTDFVDSSYKNHPVTAHDDAQIDTDEKKLGTGSLLLDGNMDYISIPDSPDWDFFASNSDDWTLDFWVKYANLIPQASFFIGQIEYAVSYWEIEHCVGYGIRPHVVKDGLDLISHTAAEITDNDWHHIALTKIGSEYRIYRDGTEVGYFQDYDTATFDGNLEIGRVGAPFNGYVDEVRISKGIARWTSDFIPPTHEYNGIPGEPPTADAGPDIEASAGQGVTLDGSFSSPDAEIVSWVWRSLSDPQKPIVAEGRITTMYAHGYVEEIIELTVANNCGETDTDTMTIISPGVIGPPGITPEEIIAIQQTIGQNRYLLEQLPQLKHDLEELLSEE